MLQWAPCFEGLDVCLKGLAQGISRMFPISLQPNWAERQQNSACFQPGSFYISKYIFIPLSGFHHPQGYASMSSDRAMRSNVWKSDTKLLLSRAYAQGPKLGIEGETSGRFSLITPTDTDGRGQSRGSNPLDSTQWVSHKASRGHRQE